MTCRACANVALITDPDDERFLYCSLPEDHKGEHYDDGADVFWRKAGSHDDEA